MTGYPSQLELQIPLLEVLAEAGGEAGSGAVREALADRFSLAEDLRGATAEIAPGHRVNRWGRHVRWAQQRARLAGYTTSPSAGIWRLSRGGEKALGDQRRGTLVTVAVTDHGVLVWADAADLAGVLDDASIQLFFSSPPFPLNRRKGYANEHSPRVHVEWLLRLVERYLPKLAERGSIVLEVGPAWTRGQPTQATWMERLVIALEDRLGLHLCQTIYWENPAKIPGPAAWTTRRRIRLTDRVERILWMAPTPYPFADNRAVLTPYSESMQRRLARGGELAQRRPSGHHRADGAFGTDNGGAIPGTVLRAPNTASNDHYTRSCKEAGLPVHPARFPVELPDFLIRFLTREDDLVVDPMCGSARTARAADRLRRRWVCGDLACEYLRGAALDLSPLPGYASHFGPRPATT